MGYQLIETIEVGSGGQASIEFASIAADWTDLYCVVNGRGTASATEVYLKLGFNGTTSGYTSKLLLGTGSAAVSVSPTQNTFAVPASSASNSTIFGNGSYYIANYSSSQYKSVSIDGVSENNATRAIQAIQALLWSDVTPITSIQITPESGIFTEHSTASLYGIK